MTGIEPFLISFLGVFFALLSFVKKDSLRDPDFYLYLMLAWMITCISVMIQIHISSPSGFYITGGVSYFLIWIPFKFFAYFLLHFGGFGNDRNESSVLAVITILLDVCALVLEQVLLESYSALYRNAPGNQVLSSSWGESPLYLILRLSYALFLRLYFEDHGFEQIEDSRNTVIATSLSILMIATIRNNAQPLAILPTFAYPIIFISFVDRTILSDKRKQQADAIEANMRQSKTALQIQREQAIETLKEHHRQREETLKLIRLLKEDQVEEASQLLTDRLKDSPEVKGLNNEYLDAALSYLRAEYPHLTFQMNSEIGTGEMIDSSDLAVLITTVIQALYPQRLDATGTAKIQISAQGTIALLHIRTIPAPEIKDRRSFNQEGMAIIRHLVQKYDGFSNDGFDSGNVKIALNQKPG